MLTTIVLGLVLASTPMASADHLFATTMDPPIFPSPGNRINILGPCLAGITDLSYPADTGFFVWHGWSTIWDESTPAEKAAFMSSGTRFELWIDGELQKSAMRTPLVNFPEFDVQVKFKIFVVEDHDGLPAGTSNFVGRWFDGGAFFGECDMTVTFT